MLENANSPTVTRNLKKISELHDKLERVTRECNHAYDCGLSDGEKKANETIEELQNKLSNAISPTKYQCAINKLHDLENKLATINRISE